TGLAYQASLAWVALAFMAGFLLERSTSIRQMAGVKKNRRGPGGFQESVASFSAYARISLPPEALENQK
ncbi:hypothetical protein, partial [Polaromonas sp.]|uniref:hypothetical protein n=1 Tax=Polaromonas sp. TaxID=1869339 RepID=UPI002735346C